MKTGDWVLCFCLGMWLCHSACADVVTSDADGFHVEQSVMIAGQPEQVFGMLTRDIGKWWDADHTFSGEASAMSVSLEKGCLLEILPNKGFVRHLEIVYFEPGKQIRFSGGLGPLQEFGVAGSLVIRTEESELGTEVKLSYRVSGSASQKLDQIAPAVDRVLAGQLKRLKSFGERER